jgi:hypothetical protein
MKKMGQAISMTIRERIVALQVEGQSLAQISRDLSIPYDTVRQLVQRYKSKGVSGLTPSYARCGHKGELRASYFYYRVCIWLKRRHLSWGAPFIHLQMSERYGQQGLPSIRQMQRWFRAKGFNVPRQNKAEAPVKPAMSVHDRWQVDAKEQLTDANGHVCTYLSVVDEHSGSSLGATLFPLFSYQSSTSRPCFGSDDSFF